MRYWLAIIDSRGMIVHDRTEIWVEFVVNAGITVCRCVLGHHRSAGHIITKCKQAVLLIVRANVILRAGSIAVQPGSMKTDIDVVAFSTPSTIKNFGRYLCRKEILWRFIKM